MRIVCQTSNNVFENDRNIPLKITRIFKRKYQMFDYFSFVIQLCNAYDYSFIRKFHSYFDPFRFRGNISIFGSTEEMPRFLVYEFMAYTRSHSL